MSGRTNKPQPDQDTSQGHEGGGRRIDLSVPVSETLPIAQEPAEDPNQPAQPSEPTNEAPSQPPPSEESAESSS